MKNQKLDKMGTSGFPVCAAILFSALIINYSFFIIHY